MKLSMKLDGMKDLEASLAELSRASARSTLERSLRKASAPMLAKAKEYAPHDDGDLAESLVIGKRVKGDPGLRAFGQVMAQGGTVSAARGALRDARRATGGSFAQLYLGPDLSKGQGATAHLVELGTGPRYTEDGRYTGEMPPDPFLRPAFDEEAGPTMARLQRILADEIQKTIRRRTARAARRAARG